jgi:hypothetical protein
LNGRSDVPGSEASADGERVAQIVGGIEKVINRRPAVTA